MHVARYQAYLKLSQIVSNCDIEQTDYVKSTQANIIIKTAKKWVSNIFKTSSTILLHNKTERCLKNISLRSPTINMTEEILPKSWGY